MSTRSAALLLLLATGAWAESHHGNGFWGDVGDVFSKVGDTLVKLAPTAAVIIGALADEESGQLHWKVCDGQTGDAITNSFDPYFLIGALNAGIVSRIYGEPKVYGSNGLLIDWGKLAGAVVTGVGAVIGEENEECPYTFCVTPAKKEVISKCFGDNRAGEGLSTARRLRLFKEENEVSKVSQFAADALKNAPGALVYDSAESLGVARTLLNNKILLKVLEGEAVALRPGKPVEESRLQGGINIGGIIGISW